MTTGKDDITRLPGVDHFFGTIDEVARNRIAWDADRQQAQTVGEIKQYLKDGRRQKAEALMKELGGGNLEKGRRMVALSGHRDKQMRALNKRKKAVEVISDPDRKRLAQERIQDAESQMNMRWLQAIDSK